MYVFRSIFVIIVWIIFVQLNRMNHICSLITTVVREHTVRSDAYEKTSKRVSLYWQIRLVASLIIFPYMKYIIIYIYYYYWNVVVVVNVLSVGRRELLTQRVLCVLFSTTRPAVVEPDPSQHESLPIKPPQQRSPTTDIKTVLSNGYRGKRPG